MRYEPAVPAIDPDMQCPDCRGTGIMREKNANYRPNVYGPHGRWIEKTCASCVARSLFREREIHGT